MSATTRRSYLLTEANDLDISAGTFQFATGLQATKQEVRSSILLILGEWFLDTNEGTAWRAKIFRKNPNLSVVKAELRGRISRVPAIKTIDTLTVNLDEQRTLTVTYSCTCDFGVFDGSVTTKAAQ